MLAQRARDHQFPPGTVPIRLAQPMYSVVPSVPSALVITIPGPIRLGRYGDSSDGIQRPMLFSLYTRDSILTNTRVFNTPNTQIASLSIEYSLSVAAAEYSACSR